MKRLKTYIKTFLCSGILMAAFLFTSCSDNINLDPEGIITKPNYFKSPEDYEKALNAAYDRIHPPKGDNLRMWLDACTDDATVNHSWNRGYDLSRGTANTSSSFPREKWEADYVSVQIATNIIENIDTYEWPGGETDVTRQTVLGEAKTLRSYFYLDLVSLFGKIMFYEKVPQTVEESKEVKQVTDPKEVFDFILKDLDEAIQSLPENSVNNSKIGKDAARMLRARAAAYAAGYLSDKKYFDITLKETEELLKKAPVLGNFGDLFVTGNETLDEVIFVRSYSLANSSVDNSWGGWYNNSVGGYCVTTPLKALVDAYEYVGEVKPNLPYENKDARLYETIYVPGSIIRGKYYNTVPGNTIEKDGKVMFDPEKDYAAYQDMEVMHGDVLGEAGGGEWNKTATGLSYKKYYSEPETWSTANSFIVFRYAEAYLLRAEALVETGGSETEAKQLIQVIRDRAGNTNSIDEMITKKYGSLLNLIRNERRVEMAQEGLRLFDLRRWKILLEVMNKPVQGVEYRDFSSGTPVNKVYTIFQREEYKERDYWWPIPQQEMDLDKENRLQQNDDWR